MPDTKRRALSRAVENSLVYILLSAPSPDRGGREPGDRSSQSPGSSLIWGVAQCHVPAKTRRLSRPSFGQAQSRAPPSRMRARLLLLCFRLLTVQPSTAVQSYARGGQPDGGPQSPYGPHQCTVSPSPIVRLSAAASCRMRRASSACRALAGPILRGPFVLRHGLVADLVVDVHVLALVHHEPVQLRHVHPGGAGH